MEPLAGHERAPTNSGHRQPSVGRQETRLCIDGERESANALPKRSIDLNETGRRPDAAKG